MRIIKFRAWHSKQKKMYSCKEMVADQLTLLTDGRFINVSGNHTSLSQICPADLMIPLQFIDRYDINGKEIYEEDIIENPSGRRCIVHWFSSPSHSGWDITPMNSKGFPPSEHAIWSEWVVLGNIYENPELRK